MEIIAPRLLSHLIVQAMVKPLNDIKESKFGIHAFLKI